MSNIVHYWRITNKTTIRYTSTRIAKTQDWQKNELWGHEDLECSYTVWAKRTRQLLWKTVRNFTKSNIQHSNPTPNLLKRNKNTRPVLKWSAASAKSCTVDLKPKTWSYESTEENTEGKVHNNTRVGKDSLVLTQKGQAKAKTNQIASN